MYKTITITIVFLLTCLQITYTIIDGLDQNIFDCNSFWYWSFTSSVIGGIYILYELLKACCCSSETNRKDVIKDELHLSTFLASIIVPLIDYILVLGEISQYEMLNSNCQTFITNAHPELWKLMNTAIALAALGILILMMFLISILIASSHQENRLTKTIQNTNKDQPVSMKRKSPKRRETEKEQERMLALQEEDE